MVAYTTTDEETNEASICNHDNLTVSEHDNGMCSETGYDDSGVYMACLDCGETWSEREHAQMEARLEATRARVLETLQRLECLRCGSERKTVVSDRVSVNPAAVCCSEVA